jgi:ornithine cyclodeaminase
MIVQMMSTLLLTRTHVEGLLDPPALVPELRAGFISYSRSNAARALRVRAPIPNQAGTATVLFPGTLPGLGVHTVKVHAKVPGQHPAIRGVAPGESDRQGWPLGGRHRRRRPERR